MRQGSARRRARRALATVRARLGDRRGRGAHPDQTATVADAPRPTVPRDSRPVRTHLGPVMDAAVARIRGMMQPAGVDPDYDLAFEHFDLTHFLLQARHFLASQAGDPLGTFLRNGARAKASPEVNFHMESYLARHPERAEGPSSPYVAWLREGRAAGEIADPAPGLEQMAPVLGMAPAEAAALLADLRTDLVTRLRTGGLGEMFARAVEVEPLIGDAWIATTSPVVPPFFSTTSSTQVAAIHRAQELAGFAPARVVLVANTPRWGGGRRAEGHIAHALARTLDPRDVLVLYTDKSGETPPDRFPEGVREVDLAMLVEGLEADAAQRVLVELLRSLRADAIVNVNSRLLYEGMSTYGRALAASERVFLMLFCNEQLALGHWVGIPLRFFYRCFDQVAGVFTDSDHLADWLRDRHQLDAAAGGDRIHVLRAPVDGRLPFVEASARPAGRRPQIFWAGRWDRQKRIDIALEVARLMPDVDLRMWGEAVLGRGHEAEVPPNVTMEGAYAHITDLDLAEADAWLYTSAWDGVPSQLLEVGMTGIPIVASLVGGVGEMLPDEHAWPVREVEDPEAYVAAIREVLADPASARRRAGGLREWLLAQRTEEAYAEHVAGLLLTSPARREVRA